MKDLCLQIYNCTSYEEVYELVHSHPLLSKSENWTPYGGNQNNCGTFENQQAKPEAALVEKLTNSIDAILTKECLVRGINPSSKSANVPKTMVEAIEKFFNITHGKWENAGTARRREIATNLQILVKGEDCLKKLNQEYKGKELLESSDDKELIKNLFANLRNNDSIRHLLSDMKGLYPFSTKKEVNKEEHNGNRKKQEVEKPKLLRFPSYFRVTNLKEKDDKIYKAVSLDSKGTITFETNAENEFLTRNTDKGELEITILGYKGRGSDGDTPRLPSTPQEKLKISRSGPNDGEIKISFEPTDKAEVGDIFEISAKMISATGEIEVIVFVGIEDKKEKGKPKKDTEEVPDLNLPECIEVVKENWDKVPKPFTIKDIVYLDIDDNGAISKIYINMGSNLLIKQANKPGVSVSKVGKKYVSNIYSHSLMLYSMLYGYYSSQEIEENIDKDALVIIKDELNQAIAQIFQYYGAFLMDFVATEVFDE